MKQNILTGISLLLALLLGFAVAKQLASWQEFRGELHNQVFSSFTANILSIAIPLIETGIAALLIPSRTQLAGLYASLAFFFSVSAYQGMAMLGVFSKVPCSCASPFEKDLGWGWGASSLVTTAAMLLSLAGILLYYSRIIYPRHFALFRQGFCRKL